MNGFIIVNESLGDAACLLRESNSLWALVPAGGILLRDNKMVTVFATRQSARKAIRRTNAYFRRRNRWPGDGPNEYTVRALEEPIEP